MATSVDEIVLFFKEQGWRHTVKSEDEDIEEVDPTAKAFNDSTPDMWEELCKNCRLYPKQILDTVTTKHDDS